jgi:hypothetical protein
MLAAYYNVGEQSSDLNRLLADPYRFGDLACNGVLSYRWTLDRRRSMLDPASVPHTLDRVVPIISARVS